MSDGIMPFASPPPPPPPRSTWTTYGVQVASWWARVGAMVLDGVVLSLPAVAIGVVLAYGVGGGSGAAVAGLVINALVLGSYFGVLNGVGDGQTIGNKATGIAVRDSTSNQPIGASRGWLRWFVRFALYMFFLLPGIVNDVWPLWDARRQTLADKVAQSVMVRI